MKHLPGETTKDELPCPAVSVSAHDEQARLQLSFGRFQQHLAGVAIFEEELSDLRPHPVTTQIICESLGGSRTLRFLFPVFGHMQDMDTLGFGEQRHCR